MRPSISGSWRKFKLSIFGGKNDSMEAEGEAKADRAPGQNAGEEEEVTDGAGGRRGGAFLTSEAPVEVSATDDEVSSASS